MWPILLADYAYVAKLWLDSLLRDQLPLHAYCSGQETLLGQPAIIFLSDLGRSVH